MLYSESEKARCDALIAAFRPYINSHVYKNSVYFDIVYSDRFGAYFKLVDVTRERDLGEMEAVVCETAQELLERILHEIVSDAVFVRPKISEEERRVLVEQVAGELLSKEGIKGEWWPVVLDYLDSEDYDD